MEEQGSSRSSRAQSWGAADGASISRARFGAVDDFLDSVDDAMFVAAPAPTRSSAPVPTTNARPHVVRRLRE